MIKDIGYSVTFPSNGLSLKGTVSLQPGITAIIGDNGNGKTFGSIEMIRYLLFGKKALRGPATDYKTLDANMTFSIRGEEYSVVRNRKGERLTDAQDEVLAVGAEAVSQRIIQLLGFGLDVFDVVCASVQKESDKLSKMLPTARRKLIDEVLGLSMNESVEKQCRDEAKALKRDAEVLQDSLSPVVLPVAPAGYRKSSTIKSQLDLARSTADRKASLLSIIAATGPAPVPVDAPVGDMAVLTAHEADRLRVEATMAHAYQELAKIPEAEWTIDQLDAAQEWCEYVAEVDRCGPPPTMTTDEAEDILEIWSHRELVLKMDRTDTVCPKCDHKFRTGEEPPAAPDVSKVEAKAAVEANRCWDNAPEQMDPIDLILTPSQIASGRRALHREADRAELLATTYLKIPYDKSAELNQLRTDQARYTAYSEAVLRHTKLRSAADAAQVEFDLLPVTVADVSALDHAYVEARVFENQQVAYEAALKVYNDTAAVASAKVVKSGEFKKGAEALIKARQSVKAYLAPSLSRVSSSLIHQMSGGVFTHMIVDEDMNITVDGQDLATLSGAGSTVANLALRLALGQVLVRNIFPVFIADEADADLSDSRAQFTAECLANLKDQLQQIIVITHKEVTAADHIITR